ncbi:MAG TPA: carboxypeptidase-like regulatory domain-containing protein [Vicinamibacterales bacterium]|nr:carboxypeptidase-like regulatory domain-containing protein [Vicinamibacterales bacterium]
MAAVNRTMAAAVVSLLLAAPAYAQQIPGQSARAGSIQGVVRGQDGRGIAGAQVELRPRAVSGRPVAFPDPRRATTTAEGIFRFVNLPAGEYSIAVTAAGFEPLTRTDLRIGRSELVTTELVLRRIGGPVPGEPPPVLEPTSPSQTPVRPRAGATGEPVPLAPGDKVFMPIPDRWNLAMPDWDRYGIGGDYPYVGGNWWNPYNTNRLKGDIPVIGKRTFFTFTGVSDTLLEGRNLPTPSGVAANRQGSERFFGRGGQYFPVTVVRTSFDLFRGDTAYRPVDWRIRVQPAFSLNFINTEEYGAVNFDVRRRSNRLASHVGVQEAFAEVKIADLSSNYDFLSVRAGIQEFSSDFRGFISVLEAPGVRLFGTIANSRIEYNAAYFDLLEKETNSAFNEWKRRGQKVWIANVYIQDFKKLGYTTSFSFHANSDRGHEHYDRNGFLVRPAPIGLIAENEVQAYYLGWSGNGHLGRLNISHAFYQVLGHETANAIAAQRLDINAQMAAAELSIDKDWLRLKAAAFYASGDSDPSDDTGRGFDAILDIPVFAGGPFSLWNRQGLRLPQTGTGLLSPSSLLPTLRTNKDEGQPNFVNPGVMLLNGAVDVELTPKLRGFANVNFLRFATTEALETLLFQGDIGPNIGIDYGAGFQYRPPLSDNIVIVGGIAGMKLGRGLQDLYVRNHLFSTFLNARLVF